METIASCTQRTGRLLRSTKVRRSAHFGFLIALTLTGCAAVPPLTESGQQVVRITPDEAKACQFLKTVTFHRTVLGAGQEPGIVDAIGENGVRNAIAAAGGNACVKAEQHPDFFAGRINFSADAYQCG